MDTEHPVVEEEGAILVLLHPLDRFLGHAVLDVFLRFVRGQPRILPRGHITARRSGARGVGNIDIEALFERRIRRRPEMPFTKMSGSVAVVLKCLGERTIGGEQSGRMVWFDRFFTGRSLRTWSRMEHGFGQMTIGDGNPGARRAETSQDGGSGRRAQRTG